MNTNNQPKSLAQIRNALCNLYNQVMEDNRKAVQVHEASNALGKAVNTCKIYLEFCELTKEKPDDQWKKFIKGNE